MGANVSNLPELNVWDCRIMKFDGWTLDIHGGVSSSLDYGSPATILRFQGVSYLECPTSFQHPQIRVATPAELERLTKREAVDSNETAFVIHADTAGELDPQDFYIVAERLDVINCNERAPND